MKRIICAGSLLAFFGHLAIAASSVQDGTLAALEAFAGTYQLVSQDIQNNPRSESPGVCFPRIIAKSDLGTVENGCPKCGAGLDIYSLPEGSGQIVVQMSHMNQGRHPLSLKIQCGAAWMVFRPLPAQSQVASSTLSPC